jgi:hypothetical protein
VLVAVDLQVESPSMKVPNDLSELIYVACTRVIQLNFLFMQQIHPSIWMNLGRSDADQLRKNAEIVLIQFANELARKSRKCKWALKAFELDQDPPYEVEANTKEWNA